MRRLVKQSRDDQYATRRDYQTIAQQQTIAFRFNNPNSRLVFETELSVGNAPFVGFGGYLKPSKSCRVRVSLIVGGVVLKEKIFSLAAEWNRIGLGMNYNGEDKVTVQVEIEGNVRRLEVWGLDCGVLNLPEILITNEIDLEDLESVHVCPETFYLPHDQALNLDINGELSSPLDIVEGVSMIELKKCSYDGRFLPLNSDLLGSLAFHRHKSKKTLHQNECRACKKWRINDDLNPTRTVDQLHESSVITRERKLLLREPEILQDIKDRHGAGLKSIVWERFGRQCFKCNKPVEVDGFQLDHTRPLSYLWPIDEYATCLCDTCNNLKKEKFPRDFYSDDELHRLAEITGLPYEELVKKDINEDSLRAIITDIPTFANTWAARTFNAVARKVKELRPDTDLFEILHQRDEEAYERIQSELSERPDDEDEEGELAGLFQE